MKRKICVIISSGERKREGDERGTKPFVKWHCIKAQSGHSERAFQHPFAWTGWAASVFQAKATQGFLVRNRTALRFIEL